MRRLLAGIILGLVLGFITGTSVAEGAPKSCVGKGARSCQTPTPVLTTTVTQTPTSTPTETATSTPTPTPTSTATPTPSLQCPPTDWNVVYPPIPEQGRSKWCASRGFTVHLVDATTSPYWHSFIAQAAADWSASAVLDVELTVAPDASCSRPGGDGTRALVKVCSFSDDPDTEPSDGHCDSIGCTDAWIMPPECCTPLGVYQRDVLVWFNDWWIEQRYHLDIQANRDVIQTIVCHEIGHSMPADGWGAAPEGWASCIYNNALVPADALATLEQIYP